MQRKVSSILHPKPNPRYNVHAEIENLKQRKTTGNENDEEPLLKFAKCLLKQCEDIRVDIRAALLALPDRKKLIVREASRLFLRRHSTDEEKIPSMIQAQKDIIEQAHCIASLIKLAFAETLTGQVPETKAEPVPKSA